MNSNCVAVGEVELRAEINDFDLWEQVVEQLSCLRIYTVKNLAEQMVAVSQKKANEAHKQLKVFSSETTGELEILRQRVSFLEQENRLLCQANNQWARWSEQFVPKQVVPKVAGEG